MHLKGVLQMKGKEKSIILLFWVSLILIPSFIYGATTVQRMNHTDSVIREN